MGVGRTGAAAIGVITLGGGGESSFGSSLAGDLETGMNDPGGGLPAYISIIMET